MHAIPFRTILLALAALVVAGAAHGARVDQLYTVETGTEDLALIGVDADQAQRAGRRSLRRDLMRAALARVLVRVAGTVEVAADADMRQGLIERAPSLVSRFQFLSRDGPQGPRIRVHFDPQGVREGLWQADWPVWGSLRPGLLVWVARRDGGGLELTGPDSNPAVFEALERAAQHRGLPLVLPLMDGTDRRRLDGRDLLMEDWEAIGEASRRYDAEAVLVLRLANVRDGLRAEWVLRSREESHAFATRGSRPEEAMSEGMQSVLEHLARMHAVRPGESSSVRAVVDGIPDLAAFARVERALGRLVAVQEVAPQRIAGDEVRFRLAFRGRPEGAARILGLVDLLEPRGGEVVPAPGQADNEGAGPAPGAEELQGVDEAPNVEPRLTFTYRP